MELYATTIKVEYEMLQANFRYSIAISEVLAGTRFSIGELGGFSIGCRHYPTTASFQDLAFSNESISFMLSDNAPNLMLQVGIETDTPIVFGSIVLAPGTLAVVSNRSTRVNVWGMSPWVLPIDFWESQTVGDLLVTDDRRPSPRRITAKPASAKSTP